MLVASFTREGSEIGRIVQTNHIEPWKLWLFKEMSPGGGGRIKACTSCHSVIDNQEQANPHFIFLFLTLYRLQHKNKLKVLVSLREEQNHFAFIVLFQNTEVRTSL